MDFLVFSPSTIAAAALLWVNNQCVEDTKSDCFHKNINIVSAAVVRHGSVINN